MTNSIFLEDTTIVVIIALIIGIVTGLMIYPTVSASIEEAYYRYGTVFEGTPDIGEPGQDGMPYGWLCYPKTPYNLRLNERMGRVVDHMGICEWR